MYLKLKLKKKKNFFFLLETGPIRLKDGTLNLAMLNFSQEEKDRQELFANGFEIADRMV